METRGYSTPPGVCTYSHACTRAHARTHTHTFTLTHTELVMYLLLLTIAIVQPFHEIDRPKINQYYEDNFSLGARNSEIETNVPVY